MAASKQDGEPNVTTDPIQCNVRAEWYWVKPGIEEVLKEHPQLTFRSEDVYHACLAKEAILWKAAEGFVVSTIEVDEFTDQRTFLICSGGGQKSAAL